MAAAMALYMAIQCYALDIIIIPLITLLYTLTKHSVVLLYYIIALKSTLSLMIPQTETLYQCNSVHFNCTHPLYFVLVILSFMFTSLMLLFVA